MIGSLTIWINIMGEGTLGIGWVTESPETVAIPWIRMSCRYLFVQDWINTLFFDDKMVESKENKNNYNNRHILLSIIYF